MKTNHPRLNPILLIGLLLSVGGTTNASPLGTAFTYQGRLTDGADAANNLYDMYFALFDVPTGGSAVGPSVNFNGVPVSNGLFTVTLDFGASPFNGDARWLQIYVRTNGGFTTPYTPLSPRQALTPAPYALFAPNAGTAYATAAGVVSNLSLAPGAVTSDKVADGTLTAADLSPTLASNTFWRLGGNAGTLPDLQFLGTTDSQPLELRINGQRALRLEPGLNGTPNVMGGSVSNRMAGGVIGATIAGGGNGLGAANRIEANYGSIGGGFGNTIMAGSTDSTIAGGTGNAIWIYASDATIGGGKTNTIQVEATDSTIAGGFGNTIGVYGSAPTVGGAIGGGIQNSIRDGASNSTIAGGFYNNIKSNAFVSSIGGGSSNTIFAGAWESTIGGGKFNIVQSNAFRGTIGGGFGNQIHVGAIYSTIAGGHANTIQSDTDSSTIGGGSGNTIQTTADSSTIGGGSGNTIQTTADSSTIGGGGGNSIQVDGRWSTIGGGVMNSIDGTESTIGGGSENSIQIYANYCTLAGGTGNTISNGAYWSTIGGGRENVIQSGAQWNTISGGDGNTIQIGAYSSCIGGGYMNTAWGLGATVPGGAANSADGDWSLAAGKEAHAAHEGTFVWADSTSGPHTSTGDDQFCIRATGGVQLSPGTSIYCGNQVRQMLNLWGTNYGIGIQAGTLYSRTSDGFAWYRGGGHNDAQYNNGGGVTLMSLNIGGLTVNGTFVSSSDRNLKENFAAVSPREVLDKVTALPISRWNFKGDAATPHIGPMAQDFHAAFALGADDKHIATVDADGVALAAIQGLNQKLEERLRTKDAEIQELRQAITELKQLVNQSTQ